MSLKNLVLRRRGLGNIPNPTDKRDWDIDRLGLRSEAPESKSLRTFVNQVRNQRSVNSCVAEAVAGAIDVRETLAGVEFAPISSLYLYWLARRQHLAERFDKGTYIRAAVKVLKAIGVPDERYWPFSTNPLRVARQPSIEAFAMAVARQGGAYYRIFDTGSARVDAIKAAITAGYPVIFGTRVARSFLFDEGGAVIDRPGLSEEIAGRHAMNIVGYAGSRTHGHLFETQNSWGGSWRDGGFCYLTEPYIRSALSRDFTIVHGWRRLYA